MKEANLNSNSRKQGQTTPSSDDTSYIIFGDGKSDKKARKPGQRGFASQNGRNNPVAAEDTSKKSDTRKLIGGPSWTGKLPVNILSEHCQKQKWAKPEYTMVRLGPDLMLMKLIPYRAKIQRGFFRW